MTDLLFRAEKEKEGAPLRREAVQTRWLRLRLRHKLRHLVRPIGHVHRSVISVSGLLEAAKLPNSQS